MYTLLIICHRKCKNTGEKKFGNTYSRMYFLLSSKKFNIVKKKVKGKKKPFAEIIT